MRWKNPLRKIIDLKALEALVEDNLFEEKASICLGLNVMMNDRIEI